MAILLNHFLGGWNPITNTPALADGTGTTGDYYIVLPQIVATSVPPADVKPYTDRDLGSGTKSWVVNFHIYYDGSEWKQMEFDDVATGNAISQQLPIPKVNLNQTAKIPYWNGSLDPLTSGAGGVMVIESAPQVVTCDIPQELLDNYRVYVEIVIFRRAVFKGVNGAIVKKYASYITPSAWIGKRVNPHVPWGEQFWTRSGAHSVNSIAATFPFPLNRPNFFPVTAVNQALNVWILLEGRYMDFKVGYRDAGTGAINTVGAIIPITRRNGGGKNTPTKRFAYSPFYTPYYFGFRYVLWDPKADNGRGQTISGPMSRVIKMQNDQFAFNPDPVATALYGLPCAKISPFFVPDIFRCQFEGRVP